MSVCRGANVSSRTIIGLDLFRGAQIVEPPPEAGLKRTPMAASATQGGLLNTDALTSCPRFQLLLRLAVYPSLRNPPQFPRGADWGEPDTQSFDLLSCPFLAIH
jgi:hypothetical protein